MNERAPVIYAYDGSGLKRCRSCRASIWWKKMDSGKVMPINGEEPHKGESHFITCPDRDKHRKRKENKTGE